MDQLIVNLTGKEHKRIFSKISVNNETKCWEWNGPKDHQGYGIVWVKPRNERIHRVIYALYNGPIPRGAINRQFHQIDHLCRNHSCCNPEHLEMVSQKENGLRGEGPQADNAKKTHCIHGHSLSTFVYRNKVRRDCKTCDSIRHKNRKFSDKSEYWKEKSRQAAKKWYYKHKSTGGDEDGQVFHVLT